MALLSSSGLSNTPSQATITKPSSDIQPYVQNVLGKGDALLNAGTPAYTGRMTAGTSDLQNKAWQGLAGLTLPTTMATAAGNLQDIQGQAQNVSFDPSQVQQYMNPYLQNALNPQLDEARRQAQISAQPAMAKLTQAGGYGGGRQAILEAENQRNLNTNLANITSQGYKAAYDDAMKSAQFATELGLKGLSAATTANQAAGNIGSQQAQYGLQNLQALSTAGGIQQGQEQAGLNAQYNEFLRQQNYLPTALKNQGELIKTMPGGTEASIYGAKQSDLSTAVGAAGGVAALIRDLKAAGKDAPAIEAALKALGINPSTLRANTYRTPEGTYVAGGSGSGNPMVYTPDASSMGGFRPVYDQSGTYIGYEDEDGKFTEID
jgi:hypothetical protein